MLWFIYKIEKECKFVQENWEGYLVNTVFANQVEYIVCMHEGKNAKYFIVKPETRQCKIKLRAFHNVVLDKIKVGKRYKSKCGIRII